MLEIGTGRVARTLKDHNGPLLTTPIIVTIIIEAAFKASAARAASIGLPILLRIVLPLHWLLLEIRLLLHHHYLLHYHHLLLVLVLVLVLLLMLVHVPRILRGRGSMESGTGGRGR